MKVKIKVTKISKLPPSKLDDFPLTNNPMTYYNKLRVFVMENDEECKKDLVEVRMGSFKGKILI